MFSVFNVHFCNDLSYIYLLLLTTVRLSEDVVVIICCYGLRLASDLTDRLAF